jgi:LPXTG-motif cell wall-anchored protein
LLLLPVAIAGFDPAKNSLNGSFWTGTLWLAIPVSIGAVQSWLYLLKKDTIAASYWLYACPVFGFLLAFIFLKEPLTLFTLAGILLVSGGLYVSQKSKKLS